MDRVKGFKIPSAVGLALALFQFSPLGIRVIVTGAAPSVWNSYVWPWLSRVLVAGIVIIAALVSAVLIRPQRPERVGVAVGAVGATLIWVLPALWAVSEELGARAGWALSEFLSLVLPLAVSCWVGANYWRSGSWRRFWRGPGGAILKGGLVAGAVGIPLSIASSWWRHAKFEELMAHMPRRRLRTARPLLPGYPWASWAVASLAGIPGAAVVTAVLASWRPKPIRGAFAGAGVTLAIGGLFLPIAALSPGWPLGLRATLVLSAVGLLKGAIVGGVAGSFAGRWEENWNE